jgi:hypothetical protein
VTKTSLELLMAWKREAPNRHVHVGNHVVAMTDGVHFSMSCSSLSPASAADKLWEWYQATQHLTIRDDFNESIVATAVPKDVSVYNDGEGETEPPQMYSISAALGVDTSKDGMN